ncbi:MAG: recombinase [Firmicutes bacterium]|jgi:recombination protein RecT|nr:recombinase [Bacillota bacterium]
MAVKNQLSQNEQPKFSEAIQRKTYQKLILNTLGDSKRAERFITAITSAVSANAELQKCDAGTILSGALLGESLNLSPSPQLGHYYLVPFKDKKRDDGVKVAQFQIGYKGYLQLAIRSGYYKKINVLPIKVGELEYFDPLEERIKVHIIEDEEIRENTETIGYYAMFEYLNGFRKAIYWSKKKMENHANIYSKSFDLKQKRMLEKGEIPEKELWKYSSFWYKNFDTMACKTMLRQLISKWGIMSIELQEAYEKDMGVVHEDGNVQYIDSQILEQQQQNQKQQQIAEQQEQQVIMEYKDTNEKQQEMTDKEFFAGT